MIANIIGKIIANNGEEIVVQTSGGVGYKIIASKNSASVFKVGQEAQVLTYLSVRENALELFGFANQEEQYLFEKLISISGIGPKSALHILALGSVSDISLAINRGDVNYLKKVSGVGGKTAERIVVELKGKMDLVFNGAMHRHSERSEESLSVGDVVEALITMGYSANSAREAVKKLDIKGKTSEQLLKEALRKVK